MSEEKRGGTAKWTRLKLFSYSGLVLLLLFLIFEVIFRIVFYFSYLGLHTSVSIQGSALKTGDTALIWKNQPFYTDHKRRFQFNEESMKAVVGDVFIPSKKEDDYWIVLTGASAMEGMGANKNGAWIDITGREDYAADATIAFYLQQLVQQQMPGKKVKVFNAACSGYCICQSYNRWVQLSKKIKADWVVSMDGCNEPAVLKGSESVRSIQQQDWEGSPQFHFPLNLIMFLTSHSAFINALKQGLFHARQSWRMESNRQKLYPERQKWRNAAVEPMRFSEINQGIQSAVDSFTLTLLRYDSLLFKQGVNHLLLVQPHMSLRDTTGLDDEETAVNRYYRAAFNYADMNVFMKLLHQQFGKQQGVKNNILSMDAVHHWKENVFVDYCHFTNAANKRIAAEISRYIVSSGKIPVFVN